LYITTTGASNVRANSVVLSGLVNGSNLYSTYNIETWFEYGTGTNFGYSTSHINSNSGYANFNATVAALSPNTVYYFRAIGQNAQGIVYGGINSFRTNFVNVVNTESNNDMSPSVTTNGATDAGNTSVQLNSLVINSISDPATAWFEWGTTPTLGNTTPTVSLGTLASARHANTITGLAPKTTYYFRAVMQNSSSKINGETLSFTTNSRTVSGSASGDVGGITNSSTLESAESAISANVFSANSFLPVNISGWMLLMILILLLIILVKHIFSSMPKKEVAQTHH
jgi:phosphodiesterase/alkaline phosphatase D-like protein